MKYTGTRLIACDLDHTLLNESSLLDRKQEETLRRLRNQGILIVIASGRPLYSIQRIIPDGMYDYAVCENGAHVYDAGNKTDLYRTLLSNEDKQILLHQMKRRHVLLAASNDSKFLYYCQREDKRLFDLYQNTRRLAGRLIGRDPDLYNIISQPEKTLSYPCAKFCFASVPFALRSLAASLDPARFSPAFVSSTWLEVMPADTDKGSGIQKVLEKEHIDAKEAACIGDGENDIAMTRVCGRSAAMVHGMSRMKKASDEIVTDSNLWLERFLHN